MQVVIASSSEAPSETLYEYYAFLVVMLSHDFSCRELKAGGQD
jgi:hypothetical protein